MEHYLTRRSFLKMTALGAACGALSTIPDSCPAQEKTVSQTPQRPNLVFVLADQWRGQALGFLGEDPVITPNLDRFARQGLVFTEAVSNYPVCSPYRAILLSGRYPYANKVISNCNNKTAPYGVELSADARCWSDVLHDQGYSLGYIGKWHLDAPQEPYLDCANNKGEIKWNEWCPPHRRHGFDFWYSYGTYDRHMRPLYWNTQAQREEFRYVDQWGPEHETDVALRYLANTGGAYRKPGQPFALVISHNPPHTAFDQYPPKYRKPYADKTDEQLVNRPNVPAEAKLRPRHRDYFAMMTGVDEQFGRILATLDEQGLAENTIVIFTSDHGCSMGSNGHDYKSNPMEESMRVPLLVRWPGHIRPGRDNLLLSNEDLYPTLLGLMGYADAIPEEVDGRNYAPLILTGKGDRPDSQWYMHASIQNPAEGRRGLRTDRYTFVVKRNDGQETVSLYDRKEDPYQQQDVAARHPEVVAELRGKLTAWLKHSRDPWAGPCVPASAPASPAETRR